MSKAHLNYYVSQIFTYNAWEINCWFCICCDYSGLIVQFLDSSNTEPPPAQNLSIAIMVNTWNYEIM